MLLNKISYPDVIRNILEIWVMKRASSACLSEIIHVVEKYFGAADVAGRFITSFKNRFFT